MVRLRTTIRQAGRNIAQNVATGFGAALVWALCGGAALADQPHEWQFGFQDAATPITERIHQFHNVLLVIIFGIALFVFGLLAYVMVRFNHRSHPVPTRTSHNTVIEVLWTVMPVVILVCIAIPSFKLMYYMDRVPDSKMTIKVTGHQWVWEYTYPDQGNINFKSLMIEDKDLKPGQPRLLEVDNPLVIPVATNIRVQVTGDDVIHSWFVPSFGFQEYAVVGRLNEAWINVEHEGTYYGECNQICGVNHAVMPIEVKVVSQADFQKWVAEKKAAAATPPAQANPTQVAAADEAAPQPAATKVAWPGN
jgi:cytochrome c oxidase subunit II